MVEIPSAHSKYFKQSCYVGNLVEDYGRINKSIAEKLRRVSKLVNYFLLNLFAIKLQVHYKLYTFSFIAVFLVFLWNISNSFLLNQKVTLAFAQNPFPILKQPNEKYPPAKNLDQVVEINKYHLEREKTSRILQ